ncbi:MAG: CDP-alcohol phosphatidyltransferase family protein [Nitrospirae bacterium]|nr:MAG: CDP-alcohol phosphatidyltransferase family protein [Nitrospirota bacterium]
MIRVSVPAVLPLNVPNSLTVLRILLVPVFVGFLVYGQYNAALITLLIAAVTDGLDGTIARMANQRTLIGAYLDPLADKLLLMSAFLSLAILHLIPVWAVILVVSRDAILLAGTLVAHVTDSPVDVSPTVLGKATTFTQIVYVVMVLLRAANYIEVAVLPPLLMAMASLTALSGLHYLYRGIVQLNGHAEDRR